MTLPAYYQYGAADMPYDNLEYGKIPLGAHQDPFKAPDKLREVQISQEGFRGFSSSDIKALTVAFLAPLLIFVTVYLLISFNWHYKYAILDLTLVAIILGLAGCLGNSAAKRMLREADGASDHFAVWAAAMFCGVVLAFFTAFSFGWRNYSSHMQPYYEYNELNSYKNIDASRMEGKAFMDAGRVSFKPGSRLDFTKSAGFMNHDTYCVAPIVSPGAPPTSYDFWAIGMNCCTGASSNFACGQPVKTDKSTGGLRLMSESELPFYKMAVTQAATKYSIKSEHPIFFHWVQDTATALSEYENTGWRDFWFALFAFVVLQALIVAVAAVGVMIVKSKYV